MGSVYEYASSSAIECVVCFECDKSNPIPQCRLSFISGTQHFLASKMSFRKLRIREYFKLSVRHLA